MIHHVNWRVKERLLNFIFFRLQFRPLCFPFLQNKNMESIFQFQFFFTFQFGNLPNAPGSWVRTQKFGVRFRFLRNFVFSTGFKIICYADRKCVSKIVEVSSTGFKISYTDRLCRNLSRSFEDHILCISDRIRDRISDRIVEKLFVVLEKS